MMEGVRKIKLSINEASLQTMNLSGMEVSQPYHLSQFIIQCMHRLGNTCNPLNLTNKRASSRSSLSDA